MEQSTSHSSQPLASQSSQPLASQEVWHVLTSLAEEVKKDWPFFSFCGLLATAALVWRWQFATVTEALGGRGVLALVLVSFPLRTFVFFVLIFWALGAGAALLHHVGRPWGFLDRVVRHVEGRFLQLTSSLLCVCLGIAAYALLYAALRNFADGLLLLRLVALVGFLLTSFFLLVSSAYRLLPFFPWPWAGGLLVGIVLLLGLLLLTDRLLGESVSHHTPPPVHSE